MARSPTPAATPVQMVAAPPVDVRHDADEYDLTGGNTHRATQRGYAIPQTDPPEARAGVLVEEGEIVPANVPVSETWMEPIKKADRQLTRALEEAGDEAPKDADLTALSKSALEAMAAERGINVKGLSKDDLITAIRAEREPTI
jgi:hypothetical protein